jgi:hypothetical protein
MLLSVAPTRLQTPDNWFWLPLIKQYVEGSAKAQYVSAKDEISWARDNVQRVAELFSDPSSAEVVCADLRALRLRNAQEVWGPATEGGASRKPNS